MLLCAFLDLTNQVCNYFEFLCKTYFVFENLKGECLKILILEKLSLKLVFWKSISSHTHAFYSLHSMLWGVFVKNQVIFSKMLFFLDFRLIQSVFRSIEIVFKIFCEPLSVSINRNWFSINRNSWIRFLKKSYLNCSNTFSKTFQTFFSLFDSARLHRDFFCRFPPNFLQSFSLLKPVCLFYPSFYIVFLIFMHYLMVFG